MIMLDRLLAPRALLSLIMAVALTLTAGWFGVERLNRERDRLTTLEAMAALGSRAPVPLLPEGLAHGGGSRRAAEAAFGRQIDQAASGHRLLVERIEQLAADRERPGLLLARIAVSGSEADIMRFVRRVESGKPAIRFADWHIGRTAPGESTIRIEGNALALWEPVG